MLVLDTDDLPPADRIEVYRAVAIGKGGSCTIEPELDDRGRFRMRLQTWNFGPVALFSSFGTGMRYSQTEQDLRRDDWSSISIFNQATGDGGFVWNDTERRLTSDDLAFACKSARYWESRWSTPGENVGLQLRAELVGLPESVIRDAMPAAGHSSLTPLLLAQLRSLRADADRLGAEPGAEAVGDAIVELVRAVLVSVTGATPVRRAVAEETRLVRILAYLTLHLTDPGLTPARVAAVHNLTLPALHRLFHAADLDVQEWIVRHRLEGARDDLASPEHSHRTIADIGRAWGHPDPVLFARGFRRAYGCSPGHWRRHHHELTDRPNAASQAPGP